MCKQLAFLTNDDISTMMLSTFIIALRCCMQMFIEGQWAVVGLFSPSLAHLCKALLSMSMDPATGPTNPTRAVTSDIISILVCAVSARSPSEGMFMPPNRTHLVPMSTHLHLRALFASTAQDVSRARYITMIARRDIDTWTVADGCLSREHQASLVSVMTFIARQAVRVQIQQLAQMRSDKQMKRRLEQGLPLQQQALEQRSLDQINPTAHFLDMLITTSRHVTAILNDDTYDVIPGLKQQLTTLRQTQGYWIGTDSLVRGMFNSKNQRKGAWFEKQLAGDYLLDILSPPSAVTTCVQQHWTLA